MLLSRIKKYLAHLVQEILQNLLLLRVLPLQLLLVALVGLEHLWSLEALGDLLHLQGLLVLWVLDYHLLQQVL